jgi:hypothetical protein
MGYETHHIRVEPLPGGRGSGEQWVRERYAMAVKAHRQRSARAKTALIVAIDADTGDVGRCLRQLREALEHAELPPRAAGEVIVHLIPKRNVETWVLCLTGRTVDEDTDYRAEAGVDGMIATAALTLFDWSRVNVAPPAHCVASLVAALPELRRIE